MKKIIIILSLAILPSFVMAKSYKRGVSENKFQYWAQMEALEPGVTWFYNWSNTLGNYFNGQEFLEFAPMCWNGNFNADNIRAYCQNNPQVKYLLGFNEPNFKAQANMTPAQAAEKWPEVQALAKELNLKIVAPALNYSPDAPYYQPTDWMDEFVALVGEDAFDFTAVHAYGGYGVMTDLATKFHERYGKPVWVTEFCYWPNESGAVAVESQIGFMTQALEWLEKTDWIYRYAWFKATEETSANYNLIKPGRSEDPRELSEQGLVYVYMSDFDPEVYHEVNTTVAAKEYISQNLILLGASSDVESECPIEVSQFNAGALIDYQFNVPANGDYTLQLKVSGIGEPSRFNPNIGVVAVDAEGKDGKVLCANKQFTLSNDNAKYQIVSFPMNLTAGKQTIRIKDYAPYQPSGIRISTVSLTDAAGIESLADIECESRPVNVYNLQGVCVLRNVMPSEVASQLAKGIYIIEGRKISIR